MVFFATRDVTNLRHILKRNEMATTKTIYGYRNDGAAIVSQRDAVLYYLKRGYSLTQNEAMKLWSVTRLPAVIHKLRRQLEQEGGRYSIVTNTVEAPNKFGAVCRFARYILIEIPEE